MKKQESFKRDNITIESFGGTGGWVTGSCHKLKIKNSTFLVDAGSYQGKFEERSEKGVRRNFEPMKNIASEVTEVLESHVHIDHTGRTPKIFKEGFTPKVLATEVTAAFMKPMLENSAEIQENEHPSNRLYDKYDVDKTLRYTKAVKPFELIDIGQKKDRITAEFIPNGHVMGSASIIIRDHSDRKTIMLTGDMGKPTQSLCGGYLEHANRFPQDPINVLMIEATNFEKEPIEFEEKKAKLVMAINEVWAGGGNPVFPTLSFHRAQEIMELFHNLQKTGEIPADCEIIIDAPLAIKVLDTIIELGPNHLSRRYGDDPRFYKTNESSIGRFELENLTIIGSHQESLLNDERLAKYNKKAIIIASGGMGGHGRVVNYIHGNFAKNDKNAILFNCFQVPGTEGFDLVHKEEMRKNKTGARIMHLEGFTSHISGPEQTFDYLGRYNLSHLETVIIVHAKDPARNSMAEEFKARGFDAKIIVPEVNQVIAC